MIELLIGSLLLSVLHAVIPNHWLPLVSLSRAERWSLPETLSITILTAFAHSFSTIGLGIVIGLIGYQLADQYEALAEIAAPLILLAMGLLYLSLDFRHVPHHHFPEQAVLRRKSKAALVVSLCIAMFFSPCLEIETYYLAAGTYGWQGIGLISAVYLIVTMAGITLMVWAGYQSLQKLRWHWLERHEKKVTGLLLILLGIFTFFIS